MKTKQGKILEKPFQESLSNLNYRVIVPELLK
jgi:hypothetical protein